jgi:putative chitinase
MIITRENLLAITTPAMADKWLNPLIATCEQFEINTPERIAGFLSQIAHESAGFSATRENLNYSAEALCRVWPSRFNAENCQEYARNPEKIANKAYSSRMGNGPEESGDGAKFLGRGLIQLTGKDNYSRFSAATGVDVVENPELVAEPEMAALSAGWFWSTNGLNALADNRDVVAMTKKINGGTHGLDDRQAKYAAVLASMEV